jgi:hypothetical protein
MELLTQDHDNFKQNRNKTYLPEIRIKILNNRCNGLLDSGSMISAINENYFKKLKENLPPDHFTTLPVRNLQIKTAVSKRSKQRKEQVMMPVNLAKELKYDLHLLIIPELSHNIIIGMDTLEGLKGKINIKNRIWEVSYENKEYKIPFIKLGQCDGENIIAYIIEETDNITQEHLEQIRKMHPELEEEFKKLIDQHKNLLKETPGFIKKISKYIIFPDI